MCVHIHIVDTVAKVLLSAPVISTLIVYMIWNIAGAD